MPDLSTFSDLDLINEVKTKNCSKAITTLIDRHSGVYHNVASQYKGNPYVKFSDAIDNKNLTIWKAAMKYDPAQGSFANLVGNMARYECYSMMYDSKKTKVSHKVSVDDIFDLHDENDKAGYSEIVSYLEEILPGDEKSHKIIMDRFVNGSAKPTPWREVAKKNGMSHWGCVLKTQEAIGKIQEKIKKEYKN